MSSQPAHTDSSRNALPVTNQLSFWLISIGFVALTQVLTVVLFGLGTIIWPALAPYKNLDQGLVVLGTLYSAALLIAVIFWKLHHSIAVGFLAGVVVSVALFPCLWILYMIFSCWFGVFCFL